jgi:hypothetical protein
MLADGMFVKKIPFVLRIHLELVVSVLIAAIEVFTNTLIDDGEVF